MSRRFRAVALTLSTAALIGSSAAETRTQEHGTAEEARAMVAAAVALYDEIGREAAFAAFEDPDGEFVNRDLYVFVFGPAREIVAHGGNPELVGTPAASLVDLDGVRFGERFMDEATEEGVWIDYHWLDPITGEDLDKSSWVVRHDGHVFGVGVYDRS